MADTKVATPKAEAEAPAPAAAAKPITEGRLTLRHGSDSRTGNDWNVVTEPGTTLEHMLEPGYWAHNAVRLRTGDKLHVQCDDRSYYAELYVRHVERTAAYVEKIVWRPFGSDLRILAPDSHEVRYMGPHRLWCVIDTKTAHVIFENMPDRPTAEGRLRGYLTSRAA